MDDYFVLSGQKVDVSGAPELITVLPLGHVISDKGEFDVDTESFDLMLAHRARRGVDLVVDYEHQTLEGVQAPAAGWVKELMLSGGEIQARVEWTPAAAEYLRNKEYRYLSPVVSVRKSDRKAMWLHSLALTNTPAIEGMPPLVNSINYNGGTNQMDMQALATLLGLGAEATAEEILQAIKKTLEENETLKAGGDGGGDDTQVVANKTVCELLGLKAGAATEDVTAKIMELKGGQVDGVNIRQELAALKAHNARRDADEAVTLALRAGKITPAQKAWAETYALSDPKGFAAFVEKAPQVIPLGEIAGDTLLPLKSDKPDEATLVACKLMGVSEEDLATYGKE